MRPSRASWLCNRWAVQESNTGCGVWADVVALLYPISVRVTLACHGWLSALSSKCVQPHHEQQVKKIWCLASCVSLASTRLAWCFLQCHLGACRLKFCLFLNTQLPSWRTIRHLDFCTETTVQRLDEEELMNNKLLLALFFAVLENSIYIMAVLLSPACQAVLSKARVLIRRDTCLHSGNRPCCAAVENRAVI